MILYKMPGSRHRDSAKVIYTVIGPIIVLDSI